MLQTVSCHRFFPGVPCEKQKLANLSARTEAASVPTKQCIGACRVILAFKVTLSQQPYQQSPKKLL